MQTLAVWLCCAMMQPGSPDILLSRIRRGMADHLAQLPNYTCRQTVERSVRYASSRRFHQLDTLRLEVSYVAGKELFGWPGDDKFEDKPLDEMVTGAIGTGNFATHARAVFVRKGPVFTYAGKTTEAGRP